MTKIFSNDKFHWEAKYSEYSRRIRVRQVQGGTKLENTFPFMERKKQSFVIIPHSVLS